MAQHHCNDIQARAILTRQATSQDIPIQDVVARMIASGGSESGSSP